MDYLQYTKEQNKKNETSEIGFKPYYKWITFNTVRFIRHRFRYNGFKPYYKWITFNTYAIKKISDSLDVIVLNLIINGLPSIHSLNYNVHLHLALRFKPYYKWITFNT